MPHIRLTGLVLFITTVFLAMAAATTQTTHIRFKRPSGELAASPSLAKPSPDPNSSSQPPLIWPPGGPYPPPDSDGRQALPSAPNAHDGGESRDAELRFVSVPVVYPLLIAAALGLGLWFVPAPQPRGTVKRKRRRR